MLETNQGLRHGDPLSPLLFIIAIDALHRLIERATEENLLPPLPGRDIKLRVSLYVDDIVLFANPDKTEIETIMHILEDFGGVLGLTINPLKSTATSIRCEELNLDEIL